MRSPRPHAATHRGCGWENRRDLWPRCPRVWFAGRMRTSRDLMATVSSRPVVAGIGASAIVVTLWAAAVPRPVRVIRLPGVSDRTTTPPAVDEEIQRGVDLELPRFTSGDASTSGVVATLLGWGTILVLVVIAVAAGVMVLRVALAAWRNRRLAPESDDVVPNLEAVALAVTADTEGRLGVLAAGSPAEGIIMAWSRLEETLGRAGVPLTVSRTSTEVTLDALRRFSVDRGALGELGALYREARYSQHELDEGDRARAEAAYRTLDADLRLVAPSSGGSRRG